MTEKKRFLDPDKRFTIMSCTGGYRIYDFQEYDIVKKDGEWFGSLKRGEAERYLNELVGRAILEKAVLG